MRSSLSVLGALSAAILVTGCGSNDAGRVAASGPGGGGTAGATTSSSSGSPTIMSCDSLPAPGVVELMSFPDLSIGATCPSWDPTCPCNFSTGAQCNVVATSVAVDPSSPGTVYAGFGPPIGLDGNKIDNGFFKSTDCGATWSKVNTSGATNMAINSGSMWWTAVDPSGIVFTTSGYGDNGIYRSTDGGVSWKDIRPTNPGVPTMPDWIQVAAIDPYDPSHLVLSFHAGCEPPMPSMCLAASNDGGDTWHLIPGPPGVSGWFEGGGILFTGRGSWIYAGGQNGGAYLYYDSDGGKYPSNPQADGWLPSPSNPVIAGGMFPAVGSDGKTLYAASSAGVVQSTDGGVSWAAIPHSPRCASVAVTGQYVYASWQWDTSGHPLWRAPLSNLEAWEQVMGGATIDGAGMSYLAYDSAHQVLYGDSYTGGVMRLVTP
jgi:hypothetical protein